MRKRLALVLVGTLAAGLMVGLPNAMADQLPAGAEGCVVNGVDASGPTGPVSHATTCTYTSTRNGGYAASGNWTMTVTVGTTTTTFTPANAPAQGCTLWGPGTTVTVTRHDSQSFIAAGNPYPSATDAIIPARPCA
jgi:hypothetical protein